MEIEASDRAAAAARARKQLAKRRKAAHAAAAPTGLDDPPDSGAHYGAPSSAPPGGPPRGAPRAAPTVPMPAPEPPAPEPALMPSLPPPPPSSGPSAGRRTHARTTSVVPCGDQPPTPRAAPTAERPSRLSGFWSAVGGIANDVANDLAHLATPALPASEAHQVPPPAQPQAESPARELPASHTGADASSLFGPALGMALTESADSASLFNSAPETAQADAIAEDVAGAPAAPPTEEAKPSEIHAGEPREGHELQDQQQVAEGYEDTNADGEQAPQYAPVQYDEQGQAYDANGQPLAIAYDEQGQAFYSDVRYDEQGQAYAPIYPMPEQETQPEYYPVQWDEQGLAYDYEGQPLPAEQDEQGQLYYPQIQYDEQGQAYYAVYSAQQEHQADQGVDEALETQIEEDVVRSAYAEGQVPGGVDAAYPSDQVLDDAPDFAELAVPPTEGHSLSPVPEDRVPEEDGAGHTAEQDSSALFDAPVPGRPEQPLGEHDPSTFLEAPTSDEAEQPLAERDPSVLFNASAAGELEQTPLEREPGASANANDQKDTGNLFDRLQESAQGPCGPSDGIGEATKDPNGFSREAEEGVQNLGNPSLGTQPATTVSHETASTAGPPDSTLNTWPASVTESIPDPNSLFGSDAVQDPNDPFRTAPAARSSWLGASNTSLTDHPERRATQGANGLFDSEPADKPCWLDESDGLAGNGHNRQSTQDAGGLFGADSAGSASWLGDLDIPIGNDNAQQDRAQDIHGLFGIEPAGQASLLGETDAGSRVELTPGQADPSLLNAKSESEHAEAHTEREFDAAPGHEPEPKCEAAPASNTETQCQQPTSACILAAQNHHPVPSADASSLFASGDDLFRTQAPSKPMWDAPRPTSATVLADTHKNEETTLSSPKAEVQKDEQPTAAGLFGPDSHDSYPSNSTKSAPQDGLQSLALSQSQPADSDGSPVLVPHASAVAELANEKASDNPDDDLAKRLFRAEVQLSDMQAQLVRQAQVVADADAKTAEMEHERDKAQDELARQREEQETALADTRKAHEPVQQELAETKGRLQAVEEQQGAAHAEALAATTRLSELSASEAQLGADHAAVKHELNEVLSRQAQLESELAKAQSATSEAESSLARAHQDLAQAHEEIARLKIEMASLNADRTELQSKIAQGSDHGDLQQAQAEVNQLHAELTATQDQLAAAKADAEHQRQAAQESRQQVTAVTAANTQAKEEWASMEASHARDIKIHVDRLAEAQRFAEEHQGRVVELEKDLAERLTQGHDNHVAEIARLEEAVAKAKEESEKHSLAAVQLSEQAEEQASKQQTQKKEHATQLAQLQAQLAEAERRGEEGSRQPLADSTDAQAALAEARAEVQAVRDVEQELRARLADTDDLRAEMEEMAEDNKRALQLAEARIQHLEMVLREREHSLDVPGTEAPLDRPHHRRSATAAPAGVTPRARRGLHAITDPVDLPAAQRHRRAESLSMLKARIGEEAPPAVPAVTLSPPAGEPRGSTLLKGSPAQPSGQDPFHYCNSCTGDLIIV